MMRKLCVLALIFFAANTFSFAQRIAPAPVQAKLFGKLLAFYTNLGTDDFSIHVVGSPSIAREFKKMVGTRVGNATLTDVSHGDGVPSNGAKVVYFAKANQTVAEYSDQNDILTITGNPKLVKGGATLGVGMVNGKPKIMLNISNSKQQGVVWNPAILRVAEKIQ